MTQRVLFIQGAGEGTHDQWDNKLVASLERELGGRYTVCYPRMPNEDDPHYDAWKAVLFRELDTLEDGAIVVGHSVGGAFLIHSLGERTPRARLGCIVLLAAPFIGEGGWPSDEIIPRSDLAKRLPVSVPLILYHGAEDEVVPVKHVHLYEKLIPQATIRTLQRSDHQLNNDLSQVARDIRSLATA
jgi:predicted alpha/beta hydrolase family esterase